MKLSRKEKKRIRNLKHNQNCFIQGIEVYRFNAYVVVLASATGMEFHESTFEESVKSAVEYIESL